ncbi:MAG: leucine-rich repeat domain-containing protein [Ruminococcus sp.]|nr:leucine-rich repeat domain-containing protein [Ruminococcus sp.]
MTEFKITNCILEKYRECGKKDVVIPDGITVIANEAFMGCTHIRSVTVPDGVKEIGRKAFDECLALEKITLPESVEKIGESAFNWCENLKEINLPDNIESIGQKAFQWCRKLTNIHLPANLRRIGEKSFRECDSITEIEIPEKVKYIGQNAFENCDRLKKITVPDRNPMTSSAIPDCSNLKYITIKGKKAQVTLKISKYTTASDILDFIIVSEKVKEVMCLKKTGKIMLAYFLAMEYDNQKAKNYILSNFIEVAEYLTDMGDSENMKLLLSYISKQYIDELIKYAIDTKKPEIQLILTKYKHDTFGFDSGESFDKFLL